MICAGTERTSDKIALAELCRPSSMSPVLVVLLQLRPRQQSVLQKLEVAACSLINGAGENAVGACNRCSKDESS